MDEREHDRRRAQRRGNLERRLTDVPVFLDRRRDQDRRSLRDRRSDVFERLYLERLAEMRAQLALIEQRVQEGA
ncbi:MAG TPA: hypothetical protein VM840_09880 [Actinomycetota bacterium]|nr:hypothetical protein [Actinomycetota bacterium]